MPSRLPSAVIVDSSPDVLQALEHLLEGVCETHVTDNFETARQLISTAPPHLLVTNVRLGAFNGIHLVYLVRAQSPETRCVVFDQRHDDGLAREAQGAGAFYERAQDLPVTLLTYAMSDLPPVDRRAHAGVPARTRRRANDCRFLQVPQPTFSTSPAWRGSSVDQK